MNGDDEILLRFLAETVHPVVRPDVTASKRLVQLYNEYIRRDGFEISEKTRISTKPLYIGRNVGIAGIPGVIAAREVLSGTDIGYVIRDLDSQMDVSGNCEASGLRGAGVQS